MTYHPPQRFSSGIAWVTCEYPEIGFPVWFTRNERFIHPGTCTAGSEEEGLRLIADAIRQAFKARPRRKTLVLLEHTAGQGRTLGYRFEHLAAIIEHLRGSARVGVCLDTCHLVASGYDIVSKSGYRKTFDTFASSDVNELTCVISVKMITAVVVGHIDINITVVVVILPGCRIAKPTIAFFVYSDSACDVFELPAAVVT